MVPMIYFSESIYGKELMATIAVNARKPTIFLDLETKHSGGGLAFTIIGGFHKVIINHPVVTKPWC